jgi:hypothetical protein
LGFTLKQFSTDPKGFFFNDVLESSPGVISLDYVVIGGGGYLDFSQGIRNEFPVFHGEIPENAIEEVMVGKNRGEYANGVWVTDAANKKYTFNSCCRSRLRWMDGNHWYEIDKQAALPQTDYMTKEVMIQMALHLVDHPDSVKGPRADYLTSLDKASQLVEFKILSPAILPEGFNFDFASYDKDHSHLRIKYDPNREAGFTAMLIDETPLNKVFLDPADNGEEIKGEKVDVNGGPGIYFSDGKYNHVLTWQSTNLKITLSIYSSEGYGGGFTKDQILAIGRSMK